LNRQNPHKWVNCQAAPTAEHAVLLMLALSRNLPVYRKNSNSIFGGVTVLGVTRTPRDEPHVDRAFDKSAMLSMQPEADSFALCLPNTPETRHIVNAAR
jgi:phosphoglycerate dehydrogenase-like enzyme